MRFILLNDRLDARFYECQSCHYLDKQRYYESSKERKYPRHFRALFQHRQRISRKCLSVNVDERPECDELLLHPWLNSKDHLAAIQSPVNESVLESCKFQKIFGIETHCLRSSRALEPGQIESFVPTSKNSIPSRMVRQCQGVPPGFGFKDATRRRSEDFRVD